jgi:hypothetical protein
VDDEWRVEVELDDQEHGYSLSERLRSLDLDDEARKRLGERVIVTRDGSRLFLYAGDESSSHEAERVIRELAEADGLSADIAVTRWHPVEQAWKDASLPLPSSEEEEQAEYEAREQAEMEEAEREGEFDWEVHVDLADRSETVELARRLSDEGHPVTRRWSYLIVPALTEERAAEMAEWLRSQVPDGTPVEVRPRFDEPASPLFVFLRAR